MKTRKNLNTMKQVLGFSIMLPLLVIFVGCGKSDDGTNSSISAGPQTYTVNGINNCNTSSGSGSTFVFDISYSSETNSAINNLQIKTTVSDGDSEEKVNTTFTDENGIIGWATCFRFGSQDWVEFEVVLEAEDGSKSNPSKVRVNKPSGAN
jgi:hypothetical protein